MSLTIPNLISLTRMGLTPFFILAVLEHKPERALAIFAIAGVTDALDGLIARYFDQRSSLGAYLDPIADKLLLTAGFVVLAIPNTHEGILIPLWITVLVLARDLAILGTVLVLQFTVSIKPFSPMGLSKVNTAMQITAVILVLISGLTNSVDALAVATLYLVAGLTVLSGLVYIQLTKKVLAEHQREKT
ncbi:MAG: CDP-alcohol phosphatidyltransferase family protein [Acidobacteria bacterium]|nr:CDP-alcohol phosphatidyltransferase family protein [Acidobacteriota bacterium]